MKNRGLLAVFSLLCLAWPQLTLAQGGKFELPVKLGSCKAKLVSTAPWKPAGPNTFSNAKRQVVLKPVGTRLELPLLSSGPMTVNPKRLSFPLDARLLPIPTSGVFSTMLASAASRSPVSTGIDTGRNIRTRVPGLFLNPNKSYLYFLATTPFQINIQGKKNTSGRSRTKRAGKKAPKFTTTAFALDPCDPAVFFAGARVNVSGIFITMEGMGVSANGQVYHTTTQKVWTGRTKANGQPHLNRYKMRGHVYAKASVGVGLGKFLSASGTAAATINLDPKGDGAIGLQEALNVIQGRMPRRTPDVRVVLEGAKQINMPMLSIPFATVAMAINTENPRKVRISFGGEKKRGGSLADLFPGTPPPGAKLFTMKGKLHIFGNATFNAATPRLNGSYQLKLRGKLRLGTAKVRGDVDVTYRVGGKPIICAKIPKLSRVCGDELDKAVVKIAEQDFKATLDSAKYFTKAGKDLEGAFDDALKVLGAAVKDSFHNFHGARKCKKESRKLGKAMGERMRSRIERQANAYFKKAKPYLKNKSPREKAIIVKKSYDELRSLIIASDQKVASRGESKVSNWSANARFKNKYRRAFRKAYDNARGDISSILQPIYRRHIGR